jgi:hypothetical protein
MKTEVVRARIETDLKESCKPEVYGQLAWPAYKAQSDILMKFTNNGPVVGPDPWKSRLDLVERYTERHRRTRHPL